MGYEKGKSIIGGSSAKKTEKEEYLPSPFRLAERKYRFYKTKTKNAQNVFTNSDQFKEVIDFRDINNNSDRNKQRIKKMSISKKEEEEITNENEYLKENFEIYTLNNKEGFYFIPNALKIEEQLDIVQNSIEKYLYAPNHTNIGTLQQNDVQFDKIINKLRWITLGYHYDWTNNIYIDQEEWKSDFPDEVTKLTEKFAKILHFSEYKSQAAIVNFYTTCLFFSPPTNSI